MKTVTPLLLTLAAILVACTASASVGQGPVYLDSAQLLVMESFPIQVRLVISGNLPTPCHELAYEIAEANPQYQIHLSVYTTVDPAVTCMQVLEPFEESIAIPLDGLADGDYSVWLNGEQVGEFSYPG